jgi:hypothetical protein
VLEIEIIYTDSDLIEIRANALSGAFRAAVDTYVTINTLRELADAIAGFPMSTTDQREFYTEKSAAGNSLRLHLQSDTAGHGQVTVDLQDRERTHQSATIRFTVEAGDVDSFVRALGALQNKKEGRATLGARATSDV